MFCKAQHHVEGGPIKKATIYGKPFNSDTLSVVTTDIWQRRSTRAGYCYFTIENATDYFIDVWIEDYYLGRLAPLSGVVRFDVAQPANWTKWYAKSLSGKTIWSNTSYCNENKAFLLKEKLSSN